MKKIFLVESIRELLIFLLISNQKEQRKFIFFDNFKSEIIENLNENIEIYPSLKLSNNKIKNIFLKLKYLKNIRNNPKILNLKNKKKVEFYGYDFSLMGIIFSEKKMNLIEDGFGFYKEVNLFNEKKLSYLKINRNLRRIMNYFLYKSKKYIYGLDTTIEKVFISSEFKDMPLPNEIRKKIEVLNLEELWNKKSKEEKEYILKIFGFVKPDIKNMEILLLTQPLSEDGVLSEKEKIELYRKIAQNYSGEKIYIKPHPREKSDYKNIFNECIVIDRDFPIELFFLLGINIKRVVTIFSTSIFNKKNIANIDVYGTEVHQKIFRRYGDYNKYIKTNKSL